MVLIGWLVVSSLFPSPREVDRFISKSQLKAWQKRAVFPSPLEVDRFISEQFNVSICEFDSRFPSSPE